MMNKIRANMEVFAKAMVQPLSYISVAGMMLVVGVLLTNDTVVGILPFLQWEPINLIGTLLFESIMIIINNLGLLFAIGIAAALARKEKHQAGLIALMSYVIFLKSNNIVLEFRDALVVPDEMIGLFGTGQTTVLGLQVTEMGVFSGIIIGLLTGYVFNRTFEKSFKGYWAMYSGTRFSFACMVAISILLGYSVTIVWPVVQAGINVLTNLIASSGSFGLFLYGMLERLLIPFGLHHLIYAPFQFAELGGVLSLGETTVVGAYPIVMTELQMGVPFSDSIYYMATGFTKTFGYLGIAAAFYKTALKENKETAKSTLIPLALTATLAGVTEPLDFMFAFAAPLLYLLHSVIAGVFVALLKIFNITAMTTGLINSAVMNVVAGVERTKFPYMYLLAIVQILVYYFLFSYLIEKFDLKTPGREKVEEEETAQVTTFKGEDERSVYAIEGLGGVDNINSLDNCFTRLRVNVVDATLVDENILKRTKHNGLVKQNENIQIIYGVEVPQIRRSIENALNNIKKEGNEK